MRAGAPDSLTTRSISPKDRFVSRRLLVLSLGLSAACLVTNPEHDPMASAGGTSVGSGGASVGSSDSPQDSHSTTADAASGSAATTIGVGDTGLGTSGPPTSSTSSEPPSTGGMTTSSSSGGSGETGSGPNPIDLGQSCAKGDGCTELGPNAECCEADQCLDTCMVPCRSVDECPFEGMGCEHGYCLFPCDANDDDCADWPGFSCEHGGEYCENDGAA